LADDWGDGVNKKIAILIGAAACAGCATFYKGDNSGPTARVRFVSHSPWATLVGALSDEHCGTSGGHAGRIALLGGPISYQVGVQKHQRLGMIGGEGLDLQYTDEVEVPAGKPFVYVFQTRNFDTKRVCDASLTFTPEAGQQYETRFILEQGTCKATLTKLVATGGGVERMKETPKTLGCHYPGNF
jgi:hypothetical protein